jgi:hypothetical protein
VGCGGAKGNDRREVVSAEGRKEDRIGECSNKKT